MKIDLKNQGHPVAPSPRGPVPAEQLQDAFKGALRQFLMPPPPAPASLPELPFNIQHQDLHLNLQSPHFDLEVVFQEIEGFEEVTEMRLAETHEDLQELKADVKEALIQDDIFEESVENREEMEEISDESSEDYEEMLEEFQEEGREIDEKKTDEKELSGPEEPDDLLEERLELDKDQEDKKKEENTREELALSKANKGRKAQGASDIEPESRAMTYQEIQDLIANVLSANKALPYKVHHLLNQVLQSLLQGQKKLITQLDMVGLEKDHWHLLSTLFPARFFGGFMEPIIATHATDYPTLDLHWNLFQDILYNRPLGPEAQQVLNQLYQISLPEYNLHKALYDKTHALPDFAEVKNWLEISQQRSLWLPGASGKLMSLALNYTHNPETGHSLFQAASHSAQGRRLSKAHQELLGQVIFERCFSHLSHENHITPILNKVLTGQELDTEETYSLLQGAPQGVLSHLPFGMMPPDLQSIMELVYTDPNYSEEHMLQFLDTSETDGPGAQESRKM